MPGMLVRFAIVTTMALLFSACASAPNKGVEAYVIDGKRRSCGEVAEIYDGATEPGSRYFNGWGPQDYSSAITLVGLCKPVAWGLNADDRKHLAANLAARKRNVDAQISATKLAVMQEERRRKIASCRATKPALLYDVESEIFRINSDLKENEAIRERQRQIAKMSGVRDLALEYRLADSTLDYQQQLKILWPRYVELGGGAPSAAAITNPIDPCDLEPAESK